MPVLYTKTYPSLGRDRVILPLGRIEMTSSFQNFQICQLIKKLHVTLEPVDQFSSFWGLFHSKFKFCHLEAGTSSFQNLLIGLSSRARLTKNDATLA